MSEESIYKMCPRCPWRIANHGKRTPGGFYTKKNLQRLWSQVRRGLKPQSCHMTDPSHPDHVAAGAPLSAQVHECPGSVALVWTLRISSGMTEGICKWMMQSDREFLNI